MIEKLLSEEKQKPSSEIKNGKIEYSFKCGIKAYQEELTLEQDEKLADILTAINMSDVAEMKLTDIFKILVKEKLVNKFLNVVLIQKEKKGKDAEFSGLKNSELQAVVSDFFILNPTVKSLLQTLGAALSSKRMSPNTSGTEQSSVD